MSEVVKFNVATSVNAKRIQGVCDEQIAYTLNLHPQQVKAVPLPRPDAPQSRAVQHLQLRKMAQALMPRVEAGDAGAIALMLKVQRREADLLGLDAPKEVINKNFVADMRDPGDLRTYTTQELQQMLADMNAIEGEHTRHD